MKVDRKQLSMYSGLVFFITLPTLRQKKQRKDLIKQKAKRYAPQLKYFFLMVLSFVIFLAGCATTSNLQNLNPISIADLHVEEEILYPDSPFNVLVQRSFHKQQHFINILDLGDEALLSRIHLIRQAKKAIYIQTYIWPFTYSGSFELKPEKQTVPFHHKDFYDHYNYAGPFPETKLSGREIKARLIKGFLGPIQPFI